MVDGRILVVTGHYGSGKTEFSVSLAMQLAREAPKRAYPKLALADLDIVNPYFRSREQEEMLEKAGVRVYGGAYGGAITAEIPELSARIRAPLQDGECQTILDVGGNSAGALVLSQFRKYLDGAEHYLVVNANRPETASAEGAELHLKEIEAVTKLKITGLVNNTHMLRETTKTDIEKGRRLCRELEARTGVPLRISCYPENLVDPADIPGKEALLPLGLYMRQSWLDHPI